MNEPSSIVLAYLTVFWVLSSTITEGALSAPQVSVNGRRILIEEPEHRQNDSILYNFMGVASNDEVTFYLEGQPSNELYVGIDETSYFFASYTLNGIGSLPSSDAFSTRTMPLPAPLVNVDGGKILIEEPKHQGNDSMLYSVIGFTRSGEIVFRVEGKKSNEMFVAIDEASYFFASYILNGSRSLPSVGIFSSSEYKLLPAPLVSVDGRKMLVKEPKHRQNDSILYNFIGFTHSGDVAFRIENQTSNELLVVIGQASYFFASYTLNGARRSEPSGCIYLAELKPPPAPLVSVDGRKILVKTTSEHEQNDSILYNFIGFNRIGQVVFRVEGQKSNELLVGIDEARYFITSYTLNGLKSIPSIGMLSTRIKPLPAPLVKVEGRKILVEEPPSEHHQHNDTLLYNFIGFTRNGEVAFNNEGQTSNELFVAIDKVSYFFVSYTLNGTESELSFGTLLETETKALPAPLVKVEGRKILVEEPPSEHHQHNDTLLYNFIGFTRNGEVAFNNEGQTSNELFVAIDKVSYFFVSYTLNGTESELSFGTLLETETKARQERQNSD